MSGKRTDLLRRAVIGVALVFGVCADGTATRAAEPIAGMIATPPTTPPPIVTLPRKPMTSLPIPQAGPVLDGVPLEILKPAETLQQRCRRLASRPIDPERPVECPVGRD